MEYEGRILCLYCSIEMVYTCKVTQQDLYTIVYDCMYCNFSEDAALVEIGSIDVSTSMGPYNLTYVTNQNSSTVFPGMS